VVPRTLSNLMHRLLQQKFRSQAARLGNSATPSRTTDLIMTTFVVGEMFESASSYRSGAGFTIPRGHRLERFPIAPKQRINILIIATHPGCRACAWPAWPKSTDVLIVCFDLLWNRWPNCYPDRRRSCASKQTGENSNHSRTAQICTTGGQPLYVLSVSVEISRGGQWLKEPVARDRDIKEIVNLWAGGSAAVKSMLARHWNECARARNYLCLACRTERPAREAHRTHVPGSQPRSY
jgi:hypothetical protein